VANGVARQATYGRRLPEAAAHQVSTGTAIAAFALYFRFLDRRWPLSSERQALEVGASWVAMTMLFEFGFGRVVAKASWEEMLADYNLARGRTWPLVLAWIGIGPLVIARREAA